MEVEVKDNRDCDKIRKKVMILSAVFFAIQGRVSFNNIQYFRLLRDVIKVRIFATVTI
jgi:hypothetical protein